MVCSMCTEGLVVRIEQRRATLCAASLRLCVSAPLDKRGRPAQISRVFMFSIMFLRWREAPWSWTRVEPPRSTVPTRPLPYTQNSLTVTLDSRTWFSIFRRPLAALGVWPSDVCITVFRTTTHRTPSLVCASVTPKYYLVRSLALPTPPPQSVLQPPTPVTPNQLPCSQLE